MRLEFVRTDSISEFQGEYRWLSNFARVPIEFGGQIYPSVEHAYQAAKTWDLEARMKIREAKTPGEAKRLGKRLKVREDWDARKIYIMRELLIQKFLHKDYAKKLVATGDMELIEGNHWGDTFWGRCNGVGKNHLGILLMEIRAAYKQTS